MKKNHPLSNLDADIRDHLKRETQDNIERGMVALSSVVVARHSTGRRLDA